MFLNPIGLKDLTTKLTNLIYNQDWKTMVDWWNDHDNGSRQWTNVSISGTLTTSRQIFHDRGDPAAPDFSSFTNDVAYHDLDLSSIVPAGASAVSMAVILNSTSVVGGDAMAFRKKGNSNDINQSAIYTQLPNVPVADDIIVACDVNRKIQYVMNFAGSVNTSDLTVKGWWL